MKTSLIDNLNSIKKITNAMPKTIKEAMEYNGVDPSIDSMEKPIDSAPVDEPNAQPEKSNTDMDVMSFVDDIRKKSLRGMAQLADNPDDERYQLLKKIWQICDKKPEQQTAFNTPGGHEQQSNNNLQANHA